jgi:hypothetical protein
MKNKIKSNYGIPVMKKLNFPIGSIDRDSAIIDHWLNEDVMVWVMEIMFGKDRISRNKGLPEQRNIRPDILVSDIRLIIEFDGPLHYTEAHASVGDLIKDEVYAKHGYRVIRIPYYIQLTEEVIETLFNGIKYEKPNIWFTYPHGFLYYQVAVPADFCETGIERFRKDLIIFADQKDMIVNSMHMQARVRKSMQKVFPPSMIKELSSICDEQIIEEMIKRHDVIKHTIKFGVFEKMITSKEVFVDIKTDEEYNSGDDYDSLVYSAYVKKGGKLSRDNFNPVFEKFVEYTVESFVGSSGVLSPLSRNGSMLCFACYIGSLAEAERIFHSVDSVSAYT